MSTEYSSTKLGTMTADDIKTMFPHKGKGQTPPNNFPHPANGTHPGMKQMGDDKETDETIGTTYNE